jgi:hypothetical protein
MNWLVRFMEWVSAGMSGCVEPRCIALKDHAPKQDHDAQDGG